MPVWAIAVETKKDNPILIDNTAVRILDAVDYDFYPMFQNVPVLSQISWIARCLRFDRIVIDFIKKHPKGTIVNIGCGLDTSFERINNSSILWYDLPSRSYRFEEKIRKRVRQPHLEINKKKEFYSPPC